MKKVLGAVLAVVLASASAIGIAYAQLQVDRKSDPSPVIHGSVDITIVPTATNTTYKPRDLQGYPISRLPEASK